MHPFSSISILSQTEYALKNIKECYFQLLEKAVFETQSQALEANLVAAFELGKRQQELNIPPDEIIMLHHEAVLTLANKYPLLKLSAVSEKLTLPLMEMSMAYGLTFRQQMAQRFEDMLNNRLQHAAKLEALGTLAAGLAHDFNNILGSIVGYAEMAKDDVGAHPSAAHCIEQLLIASFRARDLVSRMLAFARQSPMQPEKINVVAAIKESILLMKSSMASNISLRFNCAFNEIIILADPAQIQQIIMNLCINAADAMPAGGTIFIDLQPVKHTPALLLADSTTMVTKDICLTIRDSGSGMTDEVKARAFDPFFTTKAPNKGSGLGLSVVYGIVARLGGKITLQSHTDGPNKGTCFSIYLPAATFVL